MMLKVGLTGGIGSGKSYIAAVFKALGVKVYEADIKAKELMTVCPSLVQGIKSIFGEQAYNGVSLNRSYIAEIAFRNPDKLKKLNELVHPEVRTDFEKWTKQFSEEPYIIKEAALLFETGSFREMDYNILVIADEQTRIRRVMERDGVKRESVMERMKNQKGDREKAAESDFVIENNGQNMLLPLIIDIDRKLNEINKSKDG